LSCSVHVVCMGLAGRVVVSLSVPMLWKGLAARRAVCGAVFVCSTSIHSGALPANAEVGREMSHCSKRVIPNGALACGGLCTSQLRQCGRAVPGVGGVFL
jgi:hypothetical protein